MNIRLQLILGERQSKKFDVPLLGHSSLEVLFVEVDHPSLPVTRFLTERV